LSPCPFLLHKVELLYCWGQIAYNILIVTVSLLYFELSLKFAANVRLLTEVAALAVLQSISDLKLNNLFVRYTVARSPLFW
jgi:hypothetical protein